MRYSFIFAFFAVACFVTTATYSADLNGIAVSDNYIYGIFSGQMSRRTCRSVPTYDVAEIDNNKINVQYNSKIITVPVTKSKTKYKGINVNKIHIEHFPWAESDPSQVDILIPEDKNIDLYLDSFGICPDAGWFSESLLVLIVPGNQGRLDYWLATHNAQSQEPNWEPPTNFFAVNVPAGFEDKLLADLLARDWVLDARREGMPAGPETVQLSFPLHKILNDDTRQMQLRENIVSALQYTLGDLLTDGDVRAVRGYQYAASIHGPAKDILKNVKYRDRWLEADTRIDITTNGTVDGTINDRIIISVLEGYLPVWKDGQKNAPPQAHMDEFALTSHGSDDLRNYQSLEDLQTLMAKALASRFGGEVEFDPNE